MCSQFWDKKCQLLETNILRSTKLYIPVGTISSSFYVVIMTHEPFLSGLDNYVQYINKCGSNPSTFSAEEFRKVSPLSVLVKRTTPLLSLNSSVFFHQILSSFGPVLMFHMDSEVKSLRGDNLRRFVSSYVKKSIGPAST